MQAYWEASFKYWDGRSFGTFYTQLTKLRLSSPIVFLFFLERCSQPRATQIYSTVSSISSSISCVHWHDLCVHRQLSGFILKNSTWFCCLEPCVSVYWYAHNIGNSPWWYLHETISVLRYHLIQRDKHYFRAGNQCSTGLWHSPTL